jgi:hypothetical protein
VYRRGIDNTEIVHAVHERPAPVIPAANCLRLPRQAKPVRAAPFGAAHRPAPGRARSKAVINPPPGDAGSCVPLIGEAPRPRAAR